MACYIFGAGDFDGLEERPGAEDYVIAADGGYTACRRGGGGAAAAAGGFRFAGGGTGAAPCGAGAGGEGRYGHDAGRQAGGAGARRDAVPSLWRHGRPADGSHRGQPSGAFCIWRITGPKAGSTDGASDGPPSGTAALCFRPGRREFCRFSAWGRTLRASPSGGRSTRWRGRP